MYTYYGLVQSGLNEIQYLNYPKNNGILKRGQNSLALNRIFPEIQHNFFHFEIYFVSFIIASKNQER
jgi:hypothetical protein